MRDPRTDPIDGDVLYQRGGTGELHVDKTDAEEVVNREKEGQRDMQKLTQSEFNAFYGGSDRPLDLSGMDLSGLRMRWLDLVGTDLHGANLSDADLRGANIHGASLNDADLRNATLGDADLRGAKLSGAKLHGANLSDADLRGADFRGADLGCADLRNATLGDAVPEPRAIDINNEQTRKIKNR